MRSLFNRDLTPSSGPYVQIVKDVPNFSTSQGPNVLVWNDTQRIIDEALKIIDSRGKKGNCPEMWDGKAAERIVDILANRIAFCDFLR